MSGGGNERQTVFVEERLVLAPIDNLAMAGGLSRAGSPSTAPSAHALGELRKEGDGISSKEISGPSFPADGHGTWNRRLPLKWWRRRNGMDQTGRHGSRGWYCSEEVRERQRTEAVLCAAVTMAAAALVVRVVRKKK